jgi:hypothetical protein
METKEMVKVFINDRTGDLGQACGLMNHFLSSGSAGGSGEVIILILTRGKPSGPHERITPASGCRVITIGNCPLFVGELSCETPFAWG